MSQPVRSRLHPALRAYPGAVLELTPEGAVGGSNGYALFNFSAAQFGSEINFNLSDPNLTVIVNVAGTDIDWNMNAVGGYNVNLNQNIIWNFFEAETIDFNRIVHDIVHAMNGSISAEHGIGLIKRDELPLYKDPVALALMRTIEMTAHTLLRRAPVSTLSAQRCVWDGDSASAPGQLRSIYVVGFIKHEAQRIRHRTGIGRAREHHQQPLHLVAEEARRRNM